MTRSHPATAACTPRRPAWHRHAAGLALLLALAGCGGGSGSGATSGGTDGGTGTTYSLAGTVQISESAAVDSDLNDPNQRSPARNDTFATAQPLATPVMLQGTVNEARSGPPGNHFLLGDPEDFFSVTLQAGQVVELEFAGSSGAVTDDIDLYLVRDDGSEAGESIGNATRFECVQATRAGTYYVDVQAFTGAAIYALRIGSVGSAGSCGNATAPLPATAQQLLARPWPAQADATTARARQGEIGLQPTAQALPAPAARARARGLVRQWGLASDDGEDAAHPRHPPQALTLPANGAQRLALARTLAQEHPRLRAGTLDLAQANAALALHSTPAALKQPATAARHAAAQATLATLLAAKALQASGAYVYVQPNWQLTRTALVGTYPPGDPNYSAQQRWHYEQIDLGNAMNRIAGLGLQPGPRPVVAVIDSGVMLDHPDLAPQLLSSGCLFVSGSIGCNSAGRNGDSLETNGSGTAFHGTHVAGTAAAATFNSVWGAGVAPMAQLLPLNVFGTNTGASSLDIVQAMRYAAGLANSAGSLPVRRADVINLSLGGGGSCSPVFQEAVNAARGAGTLVVAATGNEGRNDLGQPAPVGQPANCSGVIAVSATGPADASGQPVLAPYANTGPQVTLTAPGGVSGQPVWSSGADISGTQRIAAMAGLQGTSMAAPHVAGVLALMRYLNPALTVARIDDLIAAGALSTDLGAAGRDPAFGHGLVSASKAVAAALEAGTGLPAAPGGIVAQPAAFDLGAFQTTASLNLYASGATADTVTGLVSSQPALVAVSASTVDAGTGLGLYTLTVDRSGLAPGASASVTLTVSLASGARQSLPVTLSRAATGTRPSASFGPVYVLLIDATSPDQTVLQQRTVQPVGGRYTFQIDGIAAGSQVSVLAGTDLDNDSFIYQPGEVGGAYSASDGGRLVVNASRSDIDFTIAPLAALPVQAAAGGVAVAPRRAIQVLRP